MPKQKDGCAIFMRRTFLFFSGVSAQDFRQLYVRGFTVYHLRQLLISNR